MPNFLKHLAISAIRIRRRGLLFLLPVLLIGVSLPVHFAYGFLGIGGFLGSVLQIVSPFIIIATLASFLPPFGGWVLERVLTWSIPYTSCPDSAVNCFIDTGWTLVRDIANMGIIIALAVIAIGTIMNWQGYRLREAFPKLILVALLVNFSRVLVAIPVDITNALMSVFVEPLPSMANIGEIFAVSPPSISSYVTLDVGKIIGNLVSILLIAVFQILLGIVLLLYGLIFLIRYIVIWFITISSPIALAAYVLPLTRRSIFNKWLRQLISWALLGPIMLFYLWLVMLFGQQVGDFLPENSILPKDAILSSFVKTVWPYLVLLLLLIVAFILAISSNSIGSRLAIRYGRRWGNKAWGGIKSGARRWSRRQFARPGTKAGREIAGRLGRMPLVGGAFRGMGRALMRYGERERAQPRAEQQNYKGMAYGDLRTILQTETEPNKLIGAYLEAAEKHPGNLEKDLREDPRIKSKFQGMLKHAQFRDLQGNFLKKFPQYASAIGARPGDFVKKLNRQDIQGLSADALKGKDVATALLANQAFNQETLRGLANNPEKLRALDSSLRAYLADKGLRTKEDRMNFFRNPQNYGVAPEHQARIRTMGRGKKNIESDPHLSAMKFLETTRGEREEVARQTAEEEERTRREEIRDKIDRMTPEQKQERFRQLSSIQPISQRSQSQQTELEILGEQLAGIATGEERMAERELRERKVTPEEAEAPRMSDEELRQLETLTRQEEPLEEAQAIGLERLRAKTQEILNTIYAKPRPERNVRERELAKRLRELLVESIARGPLSETERRMNREDIEQLIDQAQNELAYAEEQSRTATHPEAAQNWEQEAGRLRRDIETLRNQLGKYE